MSQAGVKIADSGMVLAELLRDWASDYGPAMGQVFGRREPNAGSFSGRDGVLGALGV